MGRLGPLRSNLCTTPEQHVTKRVIDTGIGVPEGFDLHQTDSFGLQLVCALTEQLGGTLSVAHQGGTTFTLPFPVLETERFEATATEMSGDPAPSIRAPAA
jgi:two-component sensor histidine kinase